MQEESRNCGCGCNGDTGRSNLLNGLFGGCGDNCAVLFFIIVFLLLFTNFGTGRSC